MTISINRDVEAASCASGAAVQVCRVDELTPDLGVAALVGGQQVAVFRLVDDSIHAVQNHCPFSGAAVLSRGITGTRDGAATIASPIYKQVFALADGRCLDTMGMEPTAGLEADLMVHRVYVDDGLVLVQLGDGS